MSYFIFENKLSLSYCQTWIAIIGGWEISIWIGLNWMLGNRHLIEVCGIARRGKGWWDVLNAKISSSGMQGEKKRKLFRETCIL